MHFWSFGKRHIYHCCITSSFDNSANIQKLRRPIILILKVESSIQYCLLALSLVHGDFLRFSESFNDIIYWRQWNPQILCNFMLRNIILQMLNHLPSQSFRVLNSSPSLLQKDSASLGFFFTLNHTYLLPVNPISCSISQLLQSFVATLLLVSNSNIIFKHN